MEFSVLGASIGNPAPVDREALPRVSTQVRRVSSLALALTVALGLAGCGGKNKGTTTTPKPGSGSATEGHMADGDPVGDGTPGGGGGSGSGGTMGGGTMGGGTMGGGDTGSGGGGDPIDSGPRPPITPPNLDPSPEQARTAVQQHLNAGRLALGGKTPDPDLALREAQAALAVDATSVDAVVVMAHAYYQKHLYDTAEVLLDMLFKDREVARQNAGVYYIYGLIYDHANQNQKAFVAYQKAVELNPSYTSALVNLGIHQLSNKQYADAVGTFEKVGQLGLSDAPTLVALGSAYRGRASDYDPGSQDRDGWLLKSETAYKRAADLDRNYGLAYYDLGLLYLDADPFPGGLDTLVRLNRAKTYFEQYKDLPGVDMKLHDERIKDVSKLIKREEKKRKKAEKNK
jgi:tetratricopeptide (TPR) repeat protein